METLFQGSDEGTMVETRMEGRPRFRLFVGLCAVATSLLGIFALIEWARGIPHLNELACVMPPMAPSTAVLFVLFGFALFTRLFFEHNRRAVRAGAWINGLGGLSALVLALFTSAGLPFQLEQHGFTRITASRQVETIPLSHMSPITAACFLLAAISVLAMPSTASRRFRSWTWAAGIAVALIMTSLLLAITRALGEPLVTGGGFILPATSTIVAFMFLGLGLCAVALPRAKPLRNETEQRANHGLGIAAAGFLVAAGILAASYSGFRRFERQHQAEIEQRLSAIAELKVLQLNNFRMERMEDARIIRNNPLIERLVANAFRKPESAQARKDLQSWLGNYERLSAYNQAAIAAPDGKVLLSSPEGLSSLPAHIGQRLPEVLRSGQCELHGFYQNQADKTFSLALLTPLLGTRDAGKARWVLVLRLNTNASILTSLLDFWPGASQSAESILHQIEGDELVILNRPRLNAGLGPARRGSPAGGSLTVSSQAGRGRRGFMEGEDYRGAAVLASVRDVPNSPWILVAKIDREEAYFPLRVRMRHEIWMNLLLLVGIAGTAGFAWKQQKFDALKAQQKAERERAWLHDVISLSLNEVYIFDLASFRFEFVNEGALHNLGYGRDELLRRTAYDIKPEFTEESFRRLVSPILAGERQRLNYETVHRRKDGTEYPVESHIQTVEVRDHKAFLAIVNDISDRVRQEEERRQLARQVAQSQKMESLGSLAGGVAHDINNVLAAILALASVHKQKSPEGTPMARDMETITKACQRGATMVKGLLGFARQGLSEEREIDLNLLVLDALTLLERTTLQKIRLVKDLAQGLHPVKGDAAALNHGLLNLCVNAVDAMPDGGTLTLRTRNGDAGTVVLEVGDTGTGMPKDVLDKALDPFFTTKPQGKGTGLGLSLVFGTVKAHGGNMEIKSAPGQGTTVVVRLPVCRVRLKEPSLIENPRSAQSQRALHILLVDDEDLVHRSVPTMLEALGHRTTGVLSGEEALARLEAGFALDVVILDMNMPGMNGAETLQRLRKIRPEVPILLATGRADQLVLDLINAHRGVALLAKPYGLDDLQEALGKVASAKGCASPSG